jgi:hypothetical protein
MTHYHVVLMKHRIWRINGCPHCHFVHHKSRRGYSGIETGSLQWAAVNSYCYVLALIMLQLRVWLQQKFWNDLRCSQWRQILDIGNRKSITENNSRKTGDLGFNFWNHRAFNNIVRFQTITIPNKNVGLQRSQSGVSYKRSKQEVYLILCARYSLLKRYWISWNDNMVHP